MFVIKLLAGLSAALASNPVEEPGCVLNLMEGPPLTASWDLEGATPAISVQGADMTALITIEARAWFGGLELAWETGPHQVGADVCASIDFDLPTEAFLHSLADTYVTDLLVRVVPVDEAGVQVGQETVLPVAYALWPSGEQADPVIWDKDDLAANAPLGVLNPTGEFTPSGDLAQYVVRILPPIGQEVNLPRTSATDERTTQRTVPIDDNSDEEVE